MRWNSKASARATTGRGRDLKTHDTINVPVAFVLLSSLVRTGSRVPQQSAAPATPIGWVWAPQPQLGWPGPSNSTRPNTAALTRWAADVSPESSRPEHPRPHLTRPDGRWQSLNGVWGLNTNVTKCPGVPGDMACSALPDPPFGRTMPGGILVPFPMQAALSGVRALPRNGVGWYRRIFSLQSANFTRSNERLLLHIERCDFNCSVYIDGSLAGWHAGGYTAFTLDVSTLLDPSIADNEHEILIGFDDRQVSQPAGKQRCDAFDHPGGIFYTCTSGVWDSVWLETVPSTYIRGVRLEPSLAKRQIIVAAELCADGGSRGGTGVLTCLQPATASPPRTVFVELSYQGIPMAHGHTVEGEPIVLSVPPTIVLQAWHPESPALYSVRVVLLSKRGGDEVVVTTAFRDLRVAVPVNGGMFARSLLNGQPVFVTGVLQQGYWPDGIYTAPTDAALEADLLLTKRLGFNAVRMHMKVESRRFYHHADRLGIIVLQDMPRCEMITGKSEFWFGSELTAMVHELRSHPSVCQYQLFNEGGGGDGSCDFVCKQVQRVNAQPEDLLDRRVIDISGGGPGDCMCHLSAELCTCPGRSAICPGLNWTGQQCGCGCNGTAGFDAHQYPDPNAPLATARMISCADEYGATRGSIGHAWVGGGNATYNSSVWVGAFRDFSALLAGMISNRGLSSAIYTQISDVETEENGIQSYDRILKLTAQDADDVRGLNLRLLTALKNDDAHVDTLPLLASVFTDFAVLQMAPAISMIWGWARPGASVSVQLSAAGYSHQPAHISTVAAMNGSWLVRVPATPASSDIELNVTSGSETQSRHDLAFGVVILFGGQSNMDFNVGRAFFAPDVVKHSHDPLLRVLTVQTTVSDIPLEDITVRAMPLRSWQPITPTSVTNISAVAYFAGRQLRRQLLEGTPVGLLCSYLSGTPIEPWLPPTATATVHLNCSAASPCSTLWNGMIFPLRRYSIAAMAWWQGEGNVANMGEYGRRFEALISSWRHNWAPMASGGSPTPFFFFFLEPYSIAWYNILREQQSIAASALPEVFGVNVLDVGDRGSPYGTVHIRNKQVAGYRLALQILEVVFNHRIVAVGPVMTSATVVSASNGSQVVAVSFSDPAWPMPLRVLPTEQCKQCCSMEENPFSAGDTPVAARMKNAVHASVDSDSPLASVIHVSFSLPLASDLKFIGLHFQPYPECALHGGSGLPAQPGILAISPGLRLKSDDQMYTVIAVQPSRFPIEAGMSESVHVTGSGFVKVAGASPVCRIDPLHGASLHVLNFGSPNAYKGDECSNFVVFPANIVSATEIICTPPPVSANGPGILSVSMDNISFMNYQEGASVMYISLFEVALGRRPYLDESVGALLFQLDSSVQGSQLHISADFGGGLLAKTWRVDNASHTFSLHFSLLNLPQTLNNDMRINIRSGSRNTTKLRRLMRAPPAPASIEAVQVDHHTRSLLIQGRQFNGNGWYFGAFGNGYEPESLMQLQDALPQLVKGGINLGMVGSLNTLYFNWSSPCWPPNPDCKSYQERFLDSAAAAGFKVIYPVWEGVNFSIAGGGPYTANLSTLEANIRRVMHHKALLGFYICDDCCANSSDISLMAQAYNIIKRIDPYHITMAGIVCDSSWLWSDNAPSLIPPTADLASPVATGQPYTQLSLDFLVLSIYLSIYLSISIH